MDLLSVIRRWALREHVSIREIARRTNLSRNTIRKYLRSGEVEPKFKLPDRPSKLDAFADKLSSWVKLEASKSRKQKRTTKQLHTDLRGRVPWRGVTSSACSAPSPVCAGLVRSPRRAARRGEYGSTGQWFPVSCSGLSEPPIRHSVPEGSRPRGGRWRLHWERSPRQWFAA